MECVQVSIIEKRKNNIISHSNKLTEARYFLTVGEQKIILLLISMITPNDIDFKDYEIKISDFAKVMGLSGNSIYERMNETLDRLLSRVIHIQKPTGFLKIGWVSSAEYIEKKGVVRLSFDKKLKPYLIQVKEEFTKYRLFTITKFQSSYTIRIYMLLKQYEKIGFRKFEVIELREILGIENNKYPLFKDFKKWVLNQVKKEFETKNKETGCYVSDITFDLETIRTGREITHLKFIIKRQTFQESLPMEIPEPEVQDIIENTALEALDRYGVKGDTARKYIIQQPEAEILRCVELLEQAKKAGKVKNEGGYLVKLLEARAGQETKAEQEEKAKKQQKEAQFRKATEEEKRKERERTLSNDFFRQERKQWIDSLPDDAKAKMLEEAKNNLGFSSSMVRDLESSLIMDFVKSKIKGYDKRRNAYIEKNLH